MTPDEAQALVEKLGLKILPTAFIDYDKTPHPYPRKLISDASFFSLFSDAVVRACDVSAYEGAEIIFSLSDDVPDSLVGRFDFIYNGSVLDNVFDPAACIRNASKMLKPNASVFNYEGAAHASYAYLKFSPDWFFDFYALNNFSDCQVYIVTYGDVHAEPWKVYQFDAFAPDGSVTAPMRLPPEAMVIAVAQSAPNATIDKTPLQNVYRSAEHAAYLAACERFSRSPRRQAIQDLFPAISGAVAKSDAPRSLLSALFRRRYEEGAESLPPGHKYLGKLGSPTFLAGQP